MAKHSIGDPTPIEKIKRDDFVSFHNTQLFGKSDCLDDLKEFSAESGLSPETVLGIINNFQHLLHKYEHWIKLPDSLGVTFISIPSLTLLNEYSEDTDD
jgi:hypothetical protein